jgi:hypothetical protein
VRARERNTWKHATTRNITTSAQLITVSAVTIALHPQLDCKKDRRGIDQGMPRGQRRLRRRKHA